MKNWLVNGFIYLKKNIQKRNENLLFNFYLNLFESLKATCSCFLNCSLSRMKDLLIHFVNEISSRNFYLNLLAFRLMIHFQIITIVRCEKRNNFTLSFSFALYPNIMCNVFRFKF